MFSSHATGLAIPLTDWQDQGKLDYHQLLCELAVASQGKDADG
jgi:hypothetical protein